MMMNNVIYTRIRKHERLLSSKVSVSGVGAGPGVVTQHRLLLAEWNSQILPPISESPSTRTAADTAARSPPVCAAAIPNNRPRGPALNLTPAKNWPRRNYASHILYDNIMRTHGPGIFCNEKLNCRLNIQVDLHHNFIMAK